MTYKQLTDRIRADLFLGQEAENLIVVHNNFFQQAMYDVQDAVRCYQANQNTRYGHCSTFFNCGMTVVPKPNGAVMRVYTIDRVNQETGKEDPDAEEEWCSKAYYVPVDFDSISRYVRLAERCSSGTPAVTDALASMLFGVYRRKRRYPRPTDEGLEGLPKLPEGYHYPQASTDATGRSPGGVYAIYRGRIYVAPWIQSTETLVVEFAGVKRTWNQEDTVEDDPKFYQAISLHVDHQHESRYGTDQKRAADLFEQLRGPIGAIPVLVSRCIEESVPHRPGEQGFGHERGMGGTDGGGGLLLYNDTKASYTASCPAGQTGSPVTVVVQVGEVSSPFSTADANARAVAQAQDEATSQLVCEVEPFKYWNTQQTATASCPGADEETETPAAVGPTVTATVDANKYSSTDSQSAADAAALAAAQALADEQLVCTYYNRPASFTAHCPSGQIGADVTKNVPAAQFSSQESQIEADALAQADAQNQANTALSCSGGSGTVLLHNSSQSAEYTGQCRCHDGQFRMVTGYGTFPGGGYLTTVANDPDVIAAAQLALNNQAQSAAQARAFQAWQTACHTC